MEQLRQMGFHDESTNRTALAAAGNDVEAAEMRLGIFETSLGLLLRKKESL